MKPAAGSTAERFGRVTGLHQRGMDQPGVDRAADHHQPGRCVHLDRLHAGNIPQPGGHHPDGLRHVRPGTHTVTAIIALPVPPSNALSLRADTVVPLSPHATRTRGAAADSARTARHATVEHSTTGSTDHPEVPANGAAADARPPRWGNEVPQIRHHHRSRRPDADGGARDRSSGERESSPEPGDFTGAMTPRRAED